MPIESLPFRILNSEFNQRKQKNPQYSLRAFARSLGISHTALSHIMSGKRPVSKRSAKLISNHLSLSQEKSKALLASNPRYSKLLQKDHISIDLETFYLISDWIHYAVLSLFETKDAVNDHKWVADRLKITPSKAKKAIYRLTNLGLLTKVPSGLKQTGKPIKVENKISTEFTKKFHQGLLKKAIESLRTDPMHLRDFSSTTLAIDPQDIPYAVQRITEFRHQLTAELEAKSTPSEVYNITVQIFPVSRRNK